MTARQFPRHWAFLLSAALVAGACGSSPASPAAQAASGIAAVPSATPVTTATPTTEPTPATSPTPAPTPAPSPTPAPTPEPTAAPTPAASAGMPSGRTGRITLADLGLTLTLPKGWRSIGLTPEEIGDMLEVLPAGTLPAGIEDQLPAMMENGLRLLAMDTQRANLGSNLNVTALSFPVPLSLLRPTVESALGSIKGVRDLRIRDTEIDGVPALRIDLAMSTRVAGTRVTFLMTQVALATDRATISITVSTIKGGQTKDRDAIIGSLRLD